MAAPLATRSPVRMLILATAALLVGALLYLGYQSYRERYVVMTEEDGAAVTRIVSASLSGRSALKVAELNGTVQSTARDVRGFGWLRSDQVVKMSFSVGYFVDLSRIGADDIEWVEGSRTLIVNAPDVVPATPNTEEGRRTLVRTSGLFVTREAGEELSRRTSLAAAAKARTEAQSPERMAQAREHGRRALANLMSAPLEAMGYGGARVIVTFPPERQSHDGERWDQSRRVEDVLGGAQPAR